MVRMGTFLIATLFLNFITTLSHLHFTASRLTGLTLPVIHRDSPESPLYPGNLTQLERLLRMIKYSDARAAYLEAISAPNATIAYDKKIVLSMLRDSLFYIVKVGIGTPPVFMFLLLDTGSGLIWSQCKPCKKCYKQKMPMYDSLASTTYRKLPCNHPLCAGDKKIYECVNQQCVYDVSYGAGDVSTRGVSSLESFTVGLNDKPYVIQNLVFGCSDDTEIPVFEERGVLSGIMGFSLSPDSIVSQLSDQTGKRFSYCFPPFTQEVNFPRFVKFGNDIPKPPGVLPTTKFVAPPPGMFNYYLKLTDISVGSTLLGLQPGLFDIRQDGSGGFFIDSGTVISQIDQTTVGRNAYKAVMEAFQNHYDYFGYERIKGEVGEGFQLCYKNRPGILLKMTYHFEDYFYIVDSKYVHFHNEEQGYFCIALRPGNGRSILGAWFQQNKRIIYDMNLNVLQYYDEQCANDAPPP